jgi:hypothetical protein
MGYIGYQLNPRGLKPQSRAFMLQSITGMDWCDSLSDFREHENNVMHNNIIAMHNIKSALLGCAGLNINQLFRFVLGAW